MVSVRGFTPEPPKTDLVEGGVVTGGKPTTPRDTREQGDTNTQYNRQTTALRSPAALSQRLQTWHAVAMQCGVELHSSLTLAPPCHLAWGGLVILKREVLFLWISCEAKKELIGRRRRGRGEGRSRHVQSTRRSSAGGLGVSLAEQRGWRESSSGEWCFDVDGWCSSALNCGVKAGVVVLRGSFSVVVLKTPEWANTARDLGRWLS